MLRYDTSIAKDLAASITRLRFSKRLVSYCNTSRSHNPKDLDLTFLIWCPVHLSSDKQYISQPFISASFVLLYSFIFRSGPMASTNLTCTYLESLSILCIVVSSVSFVSSLNDSWSPISSVTIFLALYFWSAKKGMHSIGTPWYTASWKLCRPHCVINSLTLGWAGNRKRLKFIK